MIPVVSIVASQSKMGKTTVLSKMIKELKSRGYRLATIKHHRGDFHMDQPGKDTWVHYEAGADLVIMSTPSKFARIERRQEEYSLDEIIDTIKDVDIIITEGYKGENKPKIEVIRGEISRDLISKREELIGLVTDFPLDIDVDQFSFNEIGNLVDLLVEKVIK